jgi:hypothetical protein
MKSLRGILHIHSDFSYDGSNTIEEWASFLKNKGYDFVCFTEHDDSFDHHKMIQFVESCNRVCTHSFHAIPGIEFRCKNLVHILGIGMKSYRSIHDPFDAAAFIRENGGMSVIAHPGLFKRDTIQQLVKVVDGMEIWNGLKDSRFLPDPVILNLFADSKKVNQNLIAFGGADLHSISSYFPLDIYLNHDGDFDVNNQTTLFPVNIHGRYFKITSGDIQFPLSALRILRSFYVLTKKIKDNFN